MLVPDMRRLSVFTVARKCSRRSSPIGCSAYDAASTAQKDVQKDKIIRRRVEEEQYAPKGDEGQLFQKWFGFAAGLAAQAPVLLVTIVALILTGTAQQVVELVLDFWHVPYLEALTTFAAAKPWLYLVFPVLFAAVAGFAYQTGPARQRRMETIIERNKTRKARLMREDAAKAKRQRPRRVVR